MTVAIALSGATGRMGTLIQQLIADHDELTLHAALDSSSAPDNMLGADVLIDVTHFEASKQLAEFALDHGMNVVIGTSGWSAEHLDALESRIPEGRGVLVVPNFSLGSVLATHLATIAGRFYDSIEILEAHHDRKVDSPSGTAVRTAEAIAAARDGEVHAPNAEQRARGELTAGIPIHSMRLRGIVADQQVILGGQGEVLNIRHETLSNTAYAQGITLALQQAPQLQGLTVGLGELLGLEK